jgi:hypothetical protein
MFFSIGMEDSSQLAAGFFNRRHTGSRQAMKALRIVLEALVLVTVLVTLTGCLRYITHDRSKVLLPGVDIDQTLKIAAIEIDKGNTGCVLGVWAIRDQIVTAGQASRISDIYFSHIGLLKQSFNIWHLTWSIADLYDNGDQATRAALQKAYDDAKQRAKALGGLANKFVNGDKVYMGDAHSLGRRYAQTHVVVPGNPKYLQSFEEYLKKHSQTDKKAHPAS